MIYRVQDGDGRGPYRPGFSALWVDPNSTNFPTFFQEYGAGIVLEMQRIQESRGGHFGCGFISAEQLNRWFTLKEISALYGLGYHIVSMIPDAILAQSENQLVFWRKVPLSVGAIHYPLSTLLAA